MPNPQTDAPLWRPDPARIAGLPLTAFTAEAERRTGRKFPDYAALHMWSVEDPGAFWELVWDFAGVIGDKGPGPYLVDDGMPGASFFPEERLNFAENLLRRNDDGEAIVFRGEDGATRRLTWAELQALVNSLKNEVMHLAKTHQEEADSIATFTRLTAGEVLKNTRNPKLLGIALTGIRASVEQLEASHPGLTLTVNNISTYFANLGI